MRFFALLTTLFLFNSAPAFANCTEYLRRVGEWQIQRFETDDGDCYLSIGAFNAPADMKYRSYLITNQGLLMVFNSFDPGESSTSHGARVYFFFPRNQTPDMEVQGNQLSLKTTTAGIELLTDPTKYRLTGMRGGTVKESSAVSPANQGGIEFSKVKTLYLDAGFRMGQDPTANPQRNSKFIDSRGRTCSVSNSEIFKYSADGDPTFQFTDSELKEFLLNRCPNLTVNF